MKNLTITEARNRMLALADEIQNDPATVVEVTRRGKPVLAMMSSELYEALVETLEILGDPVTAAELRKALREIEQGRAIPWRTAKRRLGFRISFS